MKNLKKNAKRQISIGVSTIVILVVIFVPGRLFAQQNITSFLDVTTFLPEFSESGDVGRATLKGYVDLRNDVRNANVWFEWGETQSLSKKTTSRSVTRSDDFRTSISNLDPDKFYYYRASAQDPIGSAFGELIRFRIGDGRVDVLAEGGTGTTSIRPPSFNVYPAPEVQTFNATVVNRSTVILSARAQIDGSISTSAYFEWGEEPTVENRTPIKQIGATPSIDFSDVVGGLTPNTLYYYRPVVTNLGGRTTGSIATVFTGIGNPPGSIPATSIYVPDRPDETSPVTPSAPITETQQAQTFSTRGDVTALRAVTYQPSFTISGSRVQVQLKGYAEIPRSSSSGNVWFEWGETHELGNQTSSQVTSGRRVYSSEHITFDPTKTIFYRAVAEDVSGTSFGNTVIFRAGDVESLALAYGYSGATINTGDKLFGGSTGRFSPLTSDGQSAIVISSDVEPSNDGRGILPSSLFGWIVASVFIFIMVALGLHVFGLYTNLKKKTEKKVNGNGNGESVFGNAHTQ